LGYDDDIGDTTVFKIAGFTTSLDRQGAEAPKELDKLIGLDASHQEG